AGAAGPACGSRAAWGSKSGSRTPSTGSAGEPTAAGAESATAGAEPAAGANTPQRRRRDGLGHDTLADGSQNQGRQLLGQGVAERDQAQVVFGLVVSVVDEPDQL